MQAKLEFNHVTEGPHDINGLYVVVSPTSARSVCELWGGRKITRTWPRLQENAIATVRRIEEVASEPRPSPCDAYQEGATIDMGAGMVLVSNLYDEAPVLLSVTQCKKLLTDWMALLLSRPHKTQMLPEAVSFEYIADGAEAETQFYSAFKAGR